MSKRLTTVYEVPDDYNVTRITGTGELNVVRCEWMDALERLAAAEALLQTACDAWECGQMVTGRDGVVLADYKAACLPRDWYEAAKGVEQ